MGKKFLLLLLSVISTVCLATGLAACDSDGGTNEGANTGSNYSSSQEGSLSDSQSGSSNKDDTQEADGWDDGVYTVYTAYAAAQELGYSGTLEEFIASISGDDGADGTVWYTGAGAPSAETGSNGDMYLDTSSYDIYSKADGSWTKTGNIKGTDGVGISKVEMNEEGKLVITLTDNTYYEIEISTTETQTAEYTLTYEENDSGYTVTGISNKNATSVDIPATYNNKSVTAIGSKAFANCIYLEEVTIPDSITTIGNYAFYNCSMLESIVLPEGVTSMGKGVLYNCSLLESLTFSFNYDSSEDNNISYIGYLFGANAYTSNSECTPLSLTTVTITGTEIPESAFITCKYIETVIIESDITSIGYKAFSSCTALNNITINGTVTSFGEYPFYNTGYYNNSDNWKDGILYIDNYLVAVTSDFTGSCEILSGTKVIADYSFNQLTSITEITIPDSVTNINNYAFYYCSGFSELTIPNSVTVIGDYAFCGCSAASITLGTGVVSIGRNAFSYCGNITEITIPDNVVYLGIQAFNGCTNLATITISKNIKLIGSNAFTNTAFYNDEGNYEDGVLYLGTYLLRAKTTISGSYTVKDGTTVIASRAFEDCTLLTSVTIAESVTIIGGSVFNRCTALTSIYFGDSSNWYRTTEDTFTNGTSTTWQSASTAAEYFTETYYKLYWYKADTTTN